MARTKSRKVRRRYVIERSLQPQRGGGIGYEHGVDVSGMAVFKPTSLPGLVLWIRADQDSLKQETVSVYTKRQPLELQERLRANLLGQQDDTVITEIESNTPDAPNALIPFELESEPSSRFPAFESPAAALDRLDLSNTPDPLNPSNNRVLRLITKNPVMLPAQFSYFSISEGVKFEVSQLMQALIVTATPGVKATLSELIVYNRQLEPEELKTLEGYLAYVQNEQWKLPEGHPYLPDLSDDEVVRPTTSVYEQIRQQLQESLNELDPAIDRYKRLGEPEESKLAAVAPLRGRILSALQTIATRKGTVSRGLLRARAELPGATQPTIQQVFAAAGTSDADISREQADLSAVAAEASKFLLSIGEEARDRRDKRIDAAADIQEAKDVQDHKSQELADQMELEVRAREFMQPIRATAKELTILGDTLVAPLLTELQTDIETGVESAGLLLSGVEDTHKAILRELQDISGGLLAGDWAASNFPKFETGRAASGAFRDPFLRTLEARIAAIREEVHAGDLAWMRQTILRATRQLERMKEAAKEKRLHPFHRGSLLHHLRTVFDDLKTTVERWRARAETVQTAVKQFKDTFERAVEFQKPTPHSPEDVTFTPASLRTAVTTQFFRRVPPMDSELLGVEWIRTDASGAILKDPIRFLLDEFEAFQYSPERREFSYQTPFRDLSDAQPIRQLFREIVEPFPNSILAELPVRILPRRLERTVSGRFEFSRLDVNCIHAIRAPGATEPLSLPKYAVKNGDYFIVQNIGDTPFCVRNPGTKDDFLHLVGPGELVVFLYGESVSEVDYFYGRRPWRRGQLAYDSILRSPRCDTCTFVPELDCFVYATQKGGEDGPDDDARVEALVTPDGYLAKVDRHTDGNVYDRHDIAKVNPYAVQTIPQTALAALVMPPGTKAMVRSGGQQLPLTVSRDTRSGLALIGDASGVPLADEFGFAVVAHAPLLLLDDGQIVTKGPYGDIPVTITPVEQDTPYRLVTYLRFEELFRSYFCRPLALNSFCFVSALKLPLVTAEGKYIQVPPTTKQSETEFLYQDFVGKPKQVYRVSLMPPAVERPVELVKPVDYAVILPDLETYKVSQTILKRYHLAAEMMEAAITKLEADRKRLEFFGETRALQLRTEVDEAIQEIRRETEEFRALQPALQKIQIGLVKLPIAEDLKVSIDVLDVKIRDSLAEVQGELEAVRDSLKLYLDLLDGLEAFQAAWATVKTRCRATFERVTASVQLTTEREVKKRGVSSAPDMDRIAKSILEKQKEWEVIETEIETALKARPDTILAARDWLETLEKESREAERLAGAAETVLLLELPEALRDQEGGEQSELEAAIRSSLTELKGLFAAARPIMLWLGISPDAAEQMAYTAADLRARQPGAAQPPAAPLSVFESYENPSVTREWAPVLVKIKDTELHDTFKRDVLDALEPCKEKLKEFVARDPMQEEPELRDVELKLADATTEQLRYYRGKAAALLERFKGAWDGILSCLGGSLKAYATLEARIHGDAHKEIEALRAAAAERWKGLDAKRVAFETTLQVLQAYGDTAATSAKVDAAFERMPNIQAELESVSVGLAEAKPVWDAYAKFRSTLEWCGTALDEVEAGLGAVATAVEAEQAAARGVVLGRLRDGTGGLVAKRDALKARIAAAPAPAPEQEALFGSIETFFQQELEPYLQQVQASGDSTPFEDVLKLRDQELKLRDSLEQQERMVS